MAGSQLYIGEMLDSMDSKLTVVSDRIETMVSQLIDVATASVQSIPSLKIRASDTVQTSSSEQIVGPMLYISAGTNGSNVVFRVSGPVNGTVRVKCVLGWKTASGYPKGPTTVTYFARIAGGAGVPIRVEDGVSVMEAALTPDTVLEVGVSSGTGSSVAAIHGLASNVQVCYDLSNITTESALSIVGA